VGALLLPRACSASSTRSQIPPGTSFACTLRLKSQIYVGLQPSKRMHSAQRHAWCL
jgi:hypothetical protein